MEQLLDKISRYHLLNNLIPGVLSLYLLNMLDIMSFDMSNVMKVLFMGYFAGMVISRLGSVVVEPLFKASKIVKYKPYSDYLKAAQKDKKLSTLLTDNNMYRTMAALFLLLLVLYGGHLIPSVDAFMHTKWANLMLIALLIIIFTLSFRKQTVFIYDRIEETNKPTEE